MQKDKWKGRVLTAEIARDLIKAPEAPIQGFPPKYIWHTGPWFDIFDLQIEKIRRDIRRAVAEDRLVVYLSCPISVRGGGWPTTNVDVAKHVEHTLLGKWGEAFWILNPAQYQLESKAGTGLMNEHAEYLGLNLEQLVDLGGRPLGGDYMRMWTTVLVENGKDVRNWSVDDKLLNTGQFFDAFYFIGPRDVQSFFLSEGETLTAGIQAYFARKFATDADFCAEFSKSNADWQPLSPRTGINNKQCEARADWIRQRFDFLRYYSLKASANFSLGSHDEWLTFVHINRRRRDATKSDENFMIDGDVGNQLAGFFDGGQVDPAASETFLSRGYSR